MLLEREFISYLSRQLVKRLSTTIADIPNPAGSAELIHDLIEAELSEEDRLNDEVREILEQYSDYMRREGVSYSEMFRRAKNQMLAQRKIIKASGRDTGDAMKLSRDKITDISHKLVTAMKKSRDIRIKKDQNEVRLEIVKAITEILTVEEKADRDARNKIKTMKRDIPEGGEEFDLMRKRYYAEELKKLGIDVGGR